MRMSVCVCAHTCVRVYVWYSVTASCDDTACITAASVSIVRVIRVIARVIIRIVIRVTKVNVAHGGCAFMLFPMKCVNTYSRVIVTSPVRACVGVTERVTYMN